MPVCMPLIRFFLSRPQNTIAQEFYFFARQQLLAVPKLKGINLVQMDGAGTVFDPYCIAPLHAFLNIFPPQNFHLSHEQITGPMGLKKIDHIRELLAHELKETWETIHKRPSNEDDVVLLHDKFNTTLNSVIANYSMPTVHTDLAFDFLKRNKIKCALTTGYSRTTADIVLNQLKETLHFNATTTADEAENGTRIAMIEKNISILNAQKQEQEQKHNMRQCLFITDALSDIKNVRAAKNYPWTIGISNYSTHVGIKNIEELRSIEANDLFEMRENAKKILLASGAHAVVHDMSELPLAIAAASLALNAGKTPTTITSLNIKYPQKVDTDLNKSVRLE